MKAIYVKPASELLAYLPAQLIAESGDTVQGSGQDLTVIETDPDSLFF